MKKKWPLVNLLALLPWKPHKGGIPLCFSAAFCAVNLTPASELSLDWEDSELRCNAQGERKEGTHCVLCWVLLAMPLRCHESYRFLWSTKQLTHSGTCSHPSAIFPLTWAITWNNLPDAARPGFLSASFHTAEGGRCQVWSSENEDVQLNPRPLLLVMQNEQGN